MSDLWNEVNKAVASGEDKIKEELLADAQKVINSINELNPDEEFYVDGYLTSRGGEGMTEDNALLNSLVTWLYVMIEEDGVIVSDWLMDWYKKASAWDLAVNLKVGSSDIE